MPRIFTRTGLSVFEESFLVNHLVSNCTNLADLDLNGVTIIQESMLVFHREPYPGRLASHDRSPTT